MSPTQVLLDTDPTRVSCSVYGQVWVRMPDGKRLLLSKNKKRELASPLGGGICPDPRGLKMLADFYNLPASRLEGDDLRFEIPGDTPKERARFIERFRGWFMRRIGRENLAALRRELKQELGSELATPILTPDQIDRFGFKLVDTVESTGGGTGALSGGALTLRIHELYQVTVPSDLEKILVRAAGRPGSGLVAVTLAEIEQGYTNQGLEIGHATKAVWDLAA